MSCSQVRRELLEHFALREGLEPWPHLAHLESCADCRQEVGVDRGLVRQLRRALRDRVEGGASSEASWELVRRRIVDRPVQPWSVRVLRWGGVASAAAAATMMFAIAINPGTRLLPRTQSPAFVISLTSRAVPPVDEAGGWALAGSHTFPTQQADPPLPGWPMETQISDEIASSFDDPPIPGRMR